MMTLRKRIFRFTHAYVYVLLTSFLVSFKMSLPLVHALLIILPAFVFSIDRNKPCVTPNGEKAMCIPVTSCDIVVEALLSSNDSAIPFAKSSQCGYDNDPLICCGTTAFPVVGTTIPESNLLPGSDACGYQTKEDRIHGGTLTEIGEFPWLALLGYASNFSDEIDFKCGGTLINKRYVLTAAHCVNVSPDAGITLDIVRLGEWQISAKTDCVEDSHNTFCSDPVVDLKVEKKITHPNYNRRTGDSDIALLRLERNVQFSEFIQPICLPPFNAAAPKVGKRLFVTGWGNTENGSSSDIKLKLDVPVYSTSDCSAKLAQLRREITENQVCAGGETGRDSCQGDSGGPLMGYHQTTKGSSVQWYQEGVVAWGVGCGKKDVPAIYTRVAKYVGWILNNMSDF